MFYLAQDLDQPHCQIDLTKAVTTVKQVPDGSPMIHTSFLKLSELFVTLNICVLSVKRGEWQVGLSEEAEFKPGDVIALMHSQADYGKLIELFEFAENEVLKAFSPADLEIMKRIAA
jgi:hypothetical protein